MSQQRWLVSFITILMTALTSLVSNAVSAQGGLIELDDVALSLAHARDGIALEVELRANADALGQPLASMGSCVGQNNDCGLALEFQGRPGQWLVLKDYYYVLRYDSIFIDAGTTPLFATPYRNLVRFQNQQGDPLLANPDGLPALQVSFPVIPDGEYSHAYVSMNIGRLAAEYDSNLGSGMPCELPACTPGYMRDDNPGSVLGFAIGNSQGGLAGIRMDGVMRAFGF